MVVVAVMAIPAPGERPDGPGARAPGGRSDRRPPRGSEGTTATPVRVAASPVGSPGHMRMRPAAALPAALVAALAVVGATLDDESSAGTAEPTTTVESSSTVVATTIAGPPHTACTSVVHIGDSTSVGLMSPDFIADPALRIDAQYARVGVADFRNEISGARSIIERYRGEPNAEQVAAQEKASGFEGCWVLALGTTDAANMHAGGVQTAGERIDTMFDVVGDDPVLWVNTKTLNPTDGDWTNDQMVAWNEALVAAQARHPNLRIYDWASVVADAWFQDDGIHYTSAGNVERARLIADALLAAYPA